MTTMAILVREFPTLVPLHVMSDATKVADHLGNTRTHLGDRKINDSPSNLERELFMLVCYHLAIKNMETFLKRQGNPSGNNRSHPHN